MTVLPGIYYKTSSDVCSSWHAADQLTLINRGFKMNDHSVIYQYSARVQNCCMDADEVHIL